MRTQVGIIGAGPAGLTLSRLLHLHGIESVIIENRSRAYIEQRIRAGVLEQGSVDLYREIGAGGRMLREGMRHEGIELRFDGRGHRIDFAALTGRAITVYGQQEMVKDLIAMHLAESRPLLFDCSEVMPEQVESDRPSIRYTHNGRSGRLDCDIIAGCDGFHGVSRTVIPDKLLKIYERRYGFGWLGILAEAAPSSPELIYAAHDRGFALHSMRSPTLVRNYIQCAPDEDLANWPDDRIWQELQQRMELDGGFRLYEGRVIEKSVTPMRSFVVEPMQYGSLYLAGDAAHIVPPTGAKGMNLAIKDVIVLADALVARYRDGDTRGLQAYSQTCLRHVWKAQYFSSWMTSMLHRSGGDEFHRNLQLTQLRNLAESTAAATWLAENYAG